MTNSIKTKLARFLVPALAAIFFFSCQKDLSSPDVGNFDTIPDLVTTVNSTVSGFVTDENNAAVMGADVNAGGMHATTDKYGYFEIKNAQVVKDAAVVTVTKTGYFKGIKTYVGENNKKAFFRIKLIPKTNAGTISATAGGNVTLSNGLIIALPSDAVVLASNSSAYTGAVNVAAYWMDPTAADLNQVMPGDLRGINTAGAIKRLTSFGMVAVELTGASGELLQIAPGKKATLTFPIPSTIIANAAATIPLWSFDEAKGLWKEEGTATKTGNTYVGDVSHFSFWNCDQPANYVQFDCTIKDQDGNPVPYAAVKISIVGGSPYYDARYGYTDSSGYVHGLIPDNAQLLLEVYSSYSCGTAVYTQNLTTTSTAVSLGVITINTSTNMANVTGTVTDCSNNPVTNGYLIMLENGQYSRYSLSSTGSFNFSKLLCMTTITASLIAEDLSSTQQSAPVIQTISAGSNAIGNIQACGTSIAEFITWAVDGITTTTLTPPTDSVGHYGTPGTTSATIAGSSNISGNNISFGYDDTGIAVGSTQVLHYLYATPLNNQNTTIVTANVLHITEYGAIGQFIAGNFTTDLIDNATSVTHTVTCSFRVRRTY